MVCIYRSTCEFETKGKTKLTGRHGEDFGRLLEVDEAEATI
jgi:hypothetical protein